MEKVLCAVYSETTEQVEEHDLWLDYKDYSLESFTKKYNIIPLINHPHSDVENNQKEAHYHIDTRFLGLQPTLKNYNMVDSDLRPVVGKYLLIELSLRKNNDVIHLSTPIDLISKSKLKHKCIHKGKCPHRGYDLTNVKPINGIITCPLHSLRFNSKTKLLIK